MNKKLRKIDLKKRTVSVLSDPRLLREKAGGTLPTEMKCKTQNPPCPPSVYTCGPTAVTCA